MTAQLETKCSALVLPARYCMIAEGECNERTRYECQLWRTQVQPTHQKQHAQYLKIVQEVQAITDPSHLLKRGPLEEWELW